MPKDEVTLALDGEVSPGEFARAVTDLSRLLDAITKETAPDVGLEWIISGLEFGSAITSARCIALDAAQRKWVPKVIKGHADFAEAMESGRPIPFQSKDIQEVAGHLRALPSGGLLRVRIEMPDAGYVVAGSRITAGAPQTPPTASFGSVRGRVQTISQRKTMRFTLYDIKDGRAVYCYLPESDESEEQMRNAWGHLVDVEGVVRRDPEAGRPLTVREIVGIHRVEEAPRYSARDALGAARGVLGEFRSEEVIRRTRDE